MAAESRLELQQILELLPHRPPFLLIDRVLEVGEDRIRALKNVTINEPFFPGHFPGHPIMPGVLLIEAMAQLLGWLASYSYDFRYVAVLALISDVMVPAALKPGARVEIEGKLLSTSERDSLGAATATVDGEIVAAAQKLHDPSKNVFGFVGRGLKNANTYLWACMLLGWDVDAVDAAKLTLNTTGPEAKLDTVAVIPMLKVVSELVSED